MSQASVSVDGSVCGAIDEGLLVFLGIKCGDTVVDCDYIIQKLLKLRLFNDVDGKLNLSVSDNKSGILLVSQFTLYGDCKKGNRPSFAQAMPPVEAKALYDLFVTKLKLAYDTVRCGIFAADMKVNLTNDGPVTLLLESS